MVNWGIAGWDAVPATGVFLFCFRVCLLLMTLDGFFFSSFPFSHYLLSSSLPPSTPHDQQASLREVHKSTDREDGGMVDLASETKVTIRASRIGRGLLTSGLYLPCVVEGHLSHFQPSSCVCFFSREEYMVSTSFRLWSRGFFLTETPIESHTKTALSVIIHRGLLRFMKWACVCVSAVQLLRS